jgi:putative peptidoglycan lipid II flippase
VLGQLRLHWGVRSGGVRTVLRTFVPVFIGRGVTQISALVDVFLAGLVGPAGVAILNYAQMIGVLPVSLFGMAVSAAELPEMSSVIGEGDERAARLRTRLEAGLRRIAFFVMPSAVAFVAIGDQVIQLVYRGGRFGPNEAGWVWAVLAGAATGLLAATLGRLYASAFYALKDSRTPLRFALIRIAVSTVLGATLALAGPRALGIDARWGVAGITLGSGIAAWVEFALLRGALSRQIGPTGLSGRVTAVLSGGALLAAVVAMAASWANRGMPPLIRALLVLGVFGMVYWVYTWRAGIPEAAELRQQIFRRPRARRR